jgi:PAS domain S-box-containing protein
MTGPLADDSGTDATERLREHEEQLRLSVELDAIYEAVPFSLCLADSEWRVRRLNSSFSELLGIPREELVGRTLCEIFARQCIHPGDASPLGTGKACEICSLGSAIEDRLESGTRQKDIERRLILERGGKKLDIAVSVGTVRVHLDDTTGFLLCLRDVSEQIRSERFALTLSQAIEQSPITTVITTIDGTIEYVNPKFTETTGYTVQEALGNNPRIINSGEQPKSVYREMWDAIGSGRIWRGLFHNRKKNGELYWEEAIISPVKDAEGTIVHYLAVKQDVTERKRLEERLRLQAEAMDSTLGYIVIVDAMAEDLPAIYLNAAFQKVTGYSPDEALGKNLRFLQKDETRQSGLDEIRAGLREGRACRALVKNFRKDGSLFWNEIGIAPVRNEKGLLSHFIGISNDVTDRVNIQHELFENERRLRLSQEYANIGSWDWDIQSGEFSGSERIGPLFGHPRESLKTSYDGFLETVHPADRHFVEKAIADCLETSNSFQIEHRCVWPDGTVHWLLENGNVTREEGGRPVHLLGIVQDITARKEAEHELIRSRGEALQATRVKSEFLSSMSHELRTPMNAILGFGQLLERDSSLNPAQLDFVQEVMKAGQHLLDLINEVLDLSRIESGKIELSSERVSCAEIIKQGLGLIAPLAEKRGIRIENEEAGARFVMADRIRFKQALVNLLSNAVKYNNERGDIRVSLAKVGEMIRIEVSDTGNGIPAHRMAELFTPFNRLGRDMGEIEGTGIGLVISKRLIECMGGRIGAESEEGRGSRFWIELPTAVEDARLETGPGGEGEDIGEISSHPGTRSTVLYIEDNPANLRLVSRIFAMRENIRLLTAHASSLGLELAEAHRPQLILLDLNMPEMDGYGVLKRLRASEWGRGIPVIAVTALAMPHDIERGMAAGFSEYITKPFDIPRFLAIVDECLARGKS